MYIKRFATAVFLTILSFSPLFAQVDTLNVYQWLTLGPVETQLPVYHDQENINNQTFSLSDLLDVEPIDVVNCRPREGSTVEWSQVKELEWKSHQSEILELERGGKNPQNYWSSFYLSTNRFTEATLVLKSHHPFKLFVNG